LELAALDLAFAWNSAREPAPEAKKPVP
jgi:hypothetical protein